MHPVVRVYIYISGIRTEWQSHNNVRIGSRQVHSIITCPNDHKKPAIKYLTNRMNTYPLTHTNRDHELTLINEILKNNGYQQQPTTKSPKKHPQTTQ
jgi:hypothetical protein